MNSTRMVGLFIGLVLGIVWVAFGFGAMLLCAVMAFLGWLVAGIVTGTVSLPDILGELQGRRRQVS